MPKRRFLSCYRDLDLSKKKCVEVGDTHKHAPWSTHPGIPFCMMSHMVKS